MAPKITAPAAETPAPAAGARPSRLRGADALRPRCSAACRACSPCRAGPCAAAEPDGRAHHDGPAERRRPAEEQVEADQPAHRRASDDRAVAVLPRAELA